MLRKQALLMAAASERGTRQIISLGSGPPTFDNAAGATSIDIAWPTTAGSVAANVRTFICIALKPGTANLGAVATPAGWTLVADHIGGGYGATLGVNTGNVRVALFRIDGNNSTAGTVTVGLTPDGGNGVATGNMLRIEKTKGTWQPIVIAKAEATVDTVAAAFNPLPAMKVSRGDFLIYGFAMTDRFLGGTSLAAGTGLVPAVPGLANGGANQLGFHINSTATGRRATRGVNPIDTPQVHTILTAGINNRGPMVLARMRVR
jgi:hypothetical protein